MHPHFIFNIKTEIKIAKDFGLDFPSGPDYFRPKPPPPKPPWNPPPKPPICPKPIGTGIVSIIGGFKMLKNKVKKKEIKLE